MNSFSLVKMLLSMEKGVKKVTIKFKNISKWNTFS